MTTLTVVLVLLFVPVARIDGFESVRFLLSGS
jgi:hypothetical protein